MYLIHRPGLRDTGFCLAGLHPGTVLPVVLQIPDDGSGVGRYFPEQGVGVPLLKTPSFDRLNGVFVQFPLSDVRDETLPDTTLIQPREQRMGLRIPVVEIARHRYVLGIGGPNGKIHAVHALYRYDMAPQFFVNAIVLAGLEEVNVVIRKQAIGLDLVHDDVFFVPYSQK